MKVSRLDAFALDFLVCGYCDSDCAQPGEVKLK